MLKRNYAFNWLIGPSLFESSSAHVYFLPKLSIQSVTKIMERYSLVLITQKYFSICTIPTMAKSNSMKTRISTCV
uniref:Uncharacterized protein n=1 Tax=Arundo donax TaxID=35708 RepID=A0A0A9C928_ARUDO